MNGEPVESLQDLKRHEMKGQKMFTVSDNSVFRGLKVPAVIDHGRGWQPRNTEPAQELKYQMTSRVHGWFRTQVAPEFHPHDSISQHR